MTLIKPRKVGEVEKGKRASVGGGQSSSEYPTKKLPKRDQKQRRLMDIIGIERGNDRPLFTLEGQKKAAWRRTRKKFALFELETISQEYL